MLTAGRRPGRVGVSDQDARDLEAFLYELRDMVENARTMPMSASVLVNRDDAVALVEDILRSFPEELRHARWLLKEKEQFLGQARRTAQRIVDDAQTQARQLVHEAEDYIDQKLAAFEAVLERTLQTVQKGRTRLQVAADPIVPAGDVADAEGLGGEFFDQDDG